MPDLAHHLSLLLHTYTYPVLLALVLLESVGIPLPGEIALVTAAAYSATGQISIVIVIALAAVGAAIGGILGYWLGNRGALALLTHYGRYVGVRKLHIDRVHGFFERNGAKTILFGRFVAVLRTWAAVVAGAACMSFRKFVVYNTAGSIAWAIVFGLVGYYFGRDLPLLEAYIARTSFGIFVIVAAGILIFFWIKRKRAPEDVIATSAE